MVCVLSVMVCLWSAFGLYSFVHGLHPVCIGLFVVRIWSVLFFFIIGLWLALVCLLSGLSLYWSVYGLKLVCIGVFMVCIWSRLVC